MIGFGGPFDFDFPLFDFKTRSSDYVAINTTQEVLKAIAKMSDFNVDIQARTTLGVSLYRAYCTKCQAELACSSSIVTGDFSKEFMDFCVGHRHEVMAKETDEVVGRKFKTW